MRLGREERDGYTDNCEIDVSVTSFEAWDVLDEDYTGVDIQTLSQGNIPTLMSRSF